MSDAPRLGLPRLHLRQTDSTNTRARALGAAGAPHGTLVTASEQTAGRGRQGRAWTAPPGRALLCSLVVRDPPPLLALGAGVAVADTVDAADPVDAVGEHAQLKWPNDVLIGGAKVAGILVEGRPQEGWAALGIGLNVAVRDHDFPPELRGRAATLGLRPEALEPTLDRLLRSLEVWLTAEPVTTLAAVRERDALNGRTVRWAAGEGRADGIDDDGALRVVTEAGVQSVTAGEVHLLLG